MGSSIKELFVLSWKNIYRNKYSYIINTAILQIFMMYIGVFLLSTIFKFILYVSGQTNLTKDTIFLILTNPISVLLIFVFIILMAWLMFIEFSILTLTIYGNTVGKKYSLKVVIKNAFKKIKNLLSVQILFFIIYFILMIPLANLGMGSMLTDELYIPKFITGEITKTITGTIGYILIVIVLLYINLRLFFVLPLMMINDSSLWQNIKKSWNITKTCKRQLIGSIVLFEIIIGFISFSSMIGVTILFYYLDKDGSNLILQTLFFTLMKILVFSFAVLTKIAIVTNLVMFIVDKGEISDAFKFIDTPKKEKGESKSKLFIFGVASSLMIFFVLNTLTIYESKVNKNIEVVAHRGYTAYGVENSLEALEASKKANANFVEVDILLTKDNKFIVMHDYNLKRLAKIDKQVADMTFDELVGINIYQNDFSSKIVSFEQFVAKAKELNIKLLVELKPHGKEPSNYAKLFVEEMKRLGVDKEYKSMSLNLKLMEEINSLAEEMEVGYVIPFQYGMFADNNVDFYVIEDFSYRTILVNQALDKGKGVYVWTVNDEDKIAKYLQSNVTGIITDEVELVSSEKETLQATNSYFDKVWNILKTM